MSNGIDYRVVPAPNGQKVRVATDPQTGQMLDAQALPPKSLRYKAKKLRIRKR